MTSCNRKISREAVEKDICIYIYAQDGASKVQISYCQNIVAATV